MPESCGDLNAMQLQWNADRSRGEAVDALYGTFANVFFHNPQLFRVSGNPPKVYLLSKKSSSALDSMAEDELLSVAWFRGGRNAVCGTQEGVLNIWTAGDWGNISTRFPGHPESIDALCMVDEETVVTGSSDGMLRIVSLLPNRLLGLVGEHGDFPIEQIRMSFNKSLLASCSHDSRVKFWNIDYLFEDEDDEDDDEEGGNEDDDGDAAPMDLVDERPGQIDNRGKQVDRADKQQLSKNKQKKQQFFSGIAE